MRSIITAQASEESPEQDAGGGFYIIEVEWLEGGDFLDIARAIRSRHRRRTGGAPTHRTPKRRSFLPNPCPWPIADFGDAHACVDERL